MAEAKDTESNCFNRRLGRETEMMALESNLLTSQDHMGGKKSPYTYFVSRAMQSPTASTHLKFGQSSIDWEMDLLGSGFPKSKIARAPATPSWLFLQKEWSNNIQLKGKNLEQYLNRGFNKQYWSWVCFPNLRESECLDDTVSLFVLYWH